MRKASFRNHLLAPTRLELAPRPVEGLAGGGNGAVDVLSITLRDCRQQLAGCRISAFEAPARRRSDSFAVD